MRVQITSMDIHSSGVHACLPDGEMVLYASGKEGFEISLKIVKGDEAAHHFLNGLGNLLMAMDSNEASMEDACHALNDFGKSLAYFTYWRYNNKLVKESVVAGLRKQLAEMEADRDYQQSAKESLQRDNDTAGVT